MHQTDPSQGELSFALLAEIAVGATARVELCRVVEGPLAGEHVAVKRLHLHIADDPQFVDMFRDEVWMTAALKHPHVVEVVGWGQDAVGPWLAVEFVRGVSLQRLMKTVFETGERFTERMVVYLARCICDGLAEAHGLCTSAGEHLNLVHRDLTPGNILLGFEGQVKITDFGLAKAKQRLTKTLTGLLKGQPQYMSPEQVNGQPLDGRSDIFALGVVLFELFSGRRPWKAQSDLDAMRAITDEAPLDLGKLRPRIDRALVELVERCLEKDPARRWQSAEELRRRLDEWLDVHGYRNDNHVSLGRFVRRNAMRQMRWFERALAGEFASEAQANQPPLLTAPPPSPPTPVSGPLPVRSAGDADEERLDWGEEGPTLIQRAGPVHQEAQRLRRARSRSVTVTENLAIDEPPEEEIKTQRGVIARPPRIADDDSSELTTSPSGDRARIARSIARPDDESTPSDLGEVGQRVRSLFSEPSPDPTLGVLAPPDPDVPPLPPPAPRRRPPRVPGSGRDLPRLTEDDSRELVTRPETPDGVRVRGGRVLPAGDTAATRPLTFEEAADVAADRDEPSGPGTHVSMTAPFPSDLGPMPAPAIPSAPTGVGTFGGALSNDVDAEARRMGRAAQRAGEEAAQAAQRAEAWARAAALAGEAALLAAVGQRQLAVRKLREAQGIDEALSRGEIPPSPAIAVDRRLVSDPPPPAPRRMTPSMLRLGWPTARPAWMKDGAAMGVVVVVLVLLAVLVVVALLV